MKSSLYLRFGKRALDLAIAPATPARAIATLIARGGSTIPTGPSTDLLNAGATDAAVTAILPTSLDTTSAALNSDHVSTTLDVGLVAPPVPVVQPPTPNDAADGDLAELVPQVSGEDNEETTATDVLFTSIGSTANDLCPW